MILPTCSASLEEHPSPMQSDRRCNPGCPGRRAVAKPASHGGKQCVQRGDQGIKPISIAATIMATLKPARMFHPAFRRSSDLRAGWTSEYFFTGINTVRVDQRQHDKGAEQFSTSAATTYFGSSMVMYAPRWTSTRWTSPLLPWCTYDCGDFAEDIFIGNKVFRLTQNQGLTALKDSSLPMPLTLESRKQLRG